MLDWGDLAALEETGRVRERVSARDFAVFVEPTVSSRALLASHMHGD
jgi:DNA-binding MarR family transcriptional regulator